MGPCEAMLQVCGWLPNHPPPLHAKETLQRALSPHLLLMSPRTAQQGEKGGKRSRKLRARNVSILRHSNYHM